MIKSKNKVLLLFCILLLSIALCSCSERIDSNFVVDFETFGGTVLPSKEDSEIKEMPIPYKNGYTFEGWYDSNDYSHRVEFPLKIYKDTVLYAKYIDNSIGNLELVYNAVDGGYEVSEYNGYSFVIFIPDTHNGLPVVSVGKLTIKNSYGITSIYIGKNVSNIDHDFYYLRRLSAINVNGNSEYFSSTDGVLYNKDRTTLISYPPYRLGNNFALAEETTHIAQYAIRGCMYLQFIKLNKIVESLDNGIYDLISLRELTVPTENPYFSATDGVLYNKDKTILIIFPAWHEKAFFVVPDTVEQMAVNSFDNAIINHITIGEKVASVAKFDGCNYLEKFVVSNKNTNFCAIDGVLFDFQAKTLLKCPAILQKNGEYDYSLPSSVLKIDSFAFDNVKELKSILLNKELQEISNYAFANKCSVEKIYTQPNSSLNIIGKGAFAGIKNFLELHLTARTPPKFDDEELIDCESLKIFVPENMHGLYEYCWSSVSDKLKNEKAIENFTVTFDSNGGTFVSNVTAGYILTEPIPSNGGYDFYGWFEDFEDGSKQQFPMAITKNITLKAKWTKDI